MAQEEGTLEKPKLGMVIARRIADDIADAGWPVGEVVSSEAELLERFGVSRAVLREAIRIVEHTGAARMRRGPGGGLVVASPRREVVATAAGMYFASLGVTVGEMLDAREPLLVATVEMAADNAPTKRIRDIVAAMDEMAAHRRLGADDFVDLQRRITDLCGNPVLSLFVQALGDVGVSRLHGTRAKLDPPLTTDDALVHLKGYRRLIEAIGDREGERSVEHMRVLNAAVRGRMHERPARPRLREPPAANGALKLGERIARVIRDDIERAGWQVGSHLGPENELLERYDVSRSVLREAIRILEYHGAVRTRRGPGGGLFVAEPDSGAIVQAARVVLDYEAVDTQQLWDARKVVEDLSVRMATTRLDEPTTAMLRETLSHEAESVDRAVRDHVIHHAVAVASRNRPLVLFVDALAELSTARVRGAFRQRRASSVSTVDAHRAHELIIEAIVGGDQDRAVGRMIRHLNSAAKSF